MRVCLNFLCWPICSLKAGSTANMTSKCYLLHAVDPAVRARCSTLPCVPGIGQVGGELQAHFPDPLSEPQRLQASPSQALGGEHCNQAEGQASARVGRAWEGVCGGGHTPASASRDPSLPGEFIIGRVIKAMNNNWHPGCFRCELCDVELADLGFVKNAGR